MMPGLFTSTWARWTGACSFTAIILFSVASGIVIGGRPSETIFFALSTLKKYRSSSSLIRYTSVVPVFRAEHTGQSTVGGFLRKGAKDFQFRKFLLDMRGPAVIVYAIVDIIKSMMM